MDVCGADGGTADDVRGAVMGTFGDAPRENSRSGREILSETAESLKNKIII